MSDNSSRPGDAADLRKRAEKIAAESPENSGHLCEGDRQTLHELRVHQIELEMQNAELRRTRDDLDAARARYFALYDLAPVGYCTLSENGLVLEANLTLATLLGVARGALVSQPAARFVFEEDQGLYFLYRKTLFEKGAPQACDLRLVKRDGTAFWARLEATAAQDLDGVPVCRVALSDITERKRAESALRESEDRFARLAEQSGTIIWEVDALGLYTYVSSVAVKILGYRPDELIGRMHFYDLHPESGRAAFKADALAFFLRKEPFTDFKNAAQTKDGRAVWLVTTGLPLLAADGSFRGYRGSDTDITERKRAEDELHKLDNLQSIGLLAGGIAHDFNNILLGLFGNISIAIEDLPKEHPSYAPLEEAEKSMGRAVRLTKQLLTFAKGGDPVKEHVRLADMVAEVARFDLTGSNVSLVYHHAADLWPVEADRGQIQQVVSNLVINARQAMPNGGCLHVTLENEDLPAAAVPALRPGRYVKISVHDEGEGISPKVIGHIFDPYFTTKQTGSGLGLATVWSIINKHGGHIGVVSELGKGTVFTVYLPAASSPQPAEAKPPAAECPHPASPVKILMLDDDESISRLAARMLAPCGYTVTIAPNAQEAMELYKQEMEAGAPFDAVIMDLTIPGGPGGMEVIKDLLALDPHVRAIVSSGYAGDPIMSDPAAYGFKSSAAKPYTARALREVVASVLA